MARKKRDKKKHAEYQRNWRQRNAEKAREIVRRSTEKRINADEGYKERLTQIRVEHNRIRNIGWDQQPRRCKRWETWEIKEIYKEGVPIAQIAESLGRSYISVEKARVRYIKHAPAGFVLMRPHSKNGE